jgi:hypothetical protein
MLNVDLQDFYPIEPWFIYWYKSESSHQNGASHEIQLHSYFLSIFKPCRYRIGAEDFAVKLYILTLNTSGILRLCDNLSYKFKYVEVIKFLFKLIFYKILRSKKVNAIVFHVKHHSRSPRLLFYTYMV